MPEDAKLDRVDYIFIALYVVVALAAVAYAAYAYGNALAEIVKYCQVYICK